jgi:hypothetical protein
LKVIFILGSGHSGSTLLDLMLGAHKLAFSAGELSKLWGYSGPDVKKTCACGQRIADCDFWNEVRSRVDPCDANDDAPPSALLEAICAVSDAQVVIDSSKSIRRLRSLLATPVDLHVIHLVRDGRAVAHSNRKKGRDFRISFQKWAAIQRHARTVLEEVSPSVPTTRIRYEDLAQHPQRTIEEIQRWAGLPPDERCWTSFRERAVHLVSGNRMKRERVSRISFDLEYLTAVTHREWWAATLRQPKLLRDFGYPLLRPSYVEHQS